MAGRLVDQNSIIEFSNSNYKVIKKDLEYRPRPDQNYSRNRL